MFNWSLKQGSRLLFCVTVIILSGAAIQAAAPVLANLDVRAPTHAGRLFDALAKSWQMSLLYLFGGLSAAILPFFCALVIQRIDLWLQVGGKVAAASSAPGPSWLFRQGARFMFALSLMCFLVAGFEFLLLVWQAIVPDLISLYSHGAWINSMSNGASLLCAVLVVDRLDRWLAAIKPCSD